MAREARRLSSTGMYFVKLNGECLFKTAADKAVFETMLEKYFADGEVYGFNLSESEIRLVVKESPKGISMTVKPLTTSYARYFNRTHNITGKLFNGRFASIPIESEEEKRSFIDGLASGGKEIKSAGRVKPRKIKSVSDPQARDTKKETGDTKTDLSTEKTKKKKMPSYLL